MRIQILLVDSKHFNPFGWLIKKYLKTDFFHCAIYDPQKDELYEATLSGVRVIKKKKWLKSHKIVHTFETKTSTTRNNKIISFMRSRLNAWYGFTQYVTIFFNLKSDNSMSRTICSEFVARSCYDELGYETSKLDKETPADIYNRVSKIKKWTKL